MAKKAVRKVTANKKILLNQLAELLCQIPTINFEC